MWICQLVSLELIYITAHSGNIPQSTMFPYPDFLLPPTYSHSAREAELSAMRNKNEEDVEDDVESGLKRRRKKGFESAFEELDGEMDALWLNDDDGPGGRPRGGYSSPLGDRSLIGQQLHPVARCPTVPTFAYENPLSYSPFLSSTYSHSYPTCRYQILHLRPLPVGRQIQHRPLRLESKPHHLKYNLEHWQGLSRQI
jgi:hypothetical protein